MKKPTLGKVAIAIGIAGLVCMLGLMGIMGYKLKHNGPTVSVLKPSTEKPKIDHTSIILAEMTGYKVTWSDAEKGNYLVSNLKLAFGPNLESSEKLKNSSYYANWYKSINDGAKFEIDKQIAKSKAKEMGVIPKDLEEQINLKEQKEIQEQFKGDKEKYLKNFKDKINYTEEDIRDELGYEIVIDELRKEVMKGTELTEKQRVEYYDNNMDQFYKVPGKVDMDCLTYEKKDEAEKVLESIRSGKTTFKQAKKDIQNSNEKVGTHWAFESDFQTVDLSNTVNVRRYVPIVEKMKAGEVANLFKDDSSPYYEIIQVVHPNTSTYYGYEESKTKINSLLTTEYGDKLLEEKMVTWEKESNAKIYDIRELVKGK